MCSGVSSSLSQNLHKEVRNSSSFSSLLCLLKKQCPVSQRQTRPKRSLPSLTMYLDLFLSVFGNHILVCRLEFKPFHLWSHSLVKWLNVLDLKNECEGGSHGPGPKAISVVPFLASWSAISLPTKPTWAFIQQMDIGLVLHALLSNFLQSLTS